MPSLFSTNLLRCPVCKKADPHCVEAPHCPRCGCDLTKSADAHATACQHTIAAAACLRTGDSAEALEYAAYAWSLAHLPEIPPLACLAALRSRNFTELAFWRARISTS